VLTLVGRPTILRPGGITREMLEQVIGTVDVSPAVLRPLAEGETAASPGMKHRHYAPDAEVVVAVGSPRKIASIICREYDITEAMGKRAVILGTEQTASCYHGMECDIIGVRSEPASLCSELFAALRRWSGRADVIFAEGVPESDQGLAYMNRLLRAAGFKVLNE
jgi:L-threonylcarbamoyladenylate synthase